MVTFCSPTDCVSDYVYNRSTDGSAVFRCGRISIYGRRIFGFAGDIYTRALLLACLTNNVFVDDCVVIVRLETDYQPI